MINPLKKYRGLKGWTVRELAEKSDLNPKTISFIENDRQKGSITTLGKLATVLGVDLEELAPLMDTTAADRGRAGQAARQAKEHPGRLAGMLTKEELETAVTEGDKEIALGQGISFSQIESRLAHLIATEFEERAAG